MSTQVGSSSGREDHRQMEEIGDPFRRHNPAGGKRRHRIRFNAEDGYICRRFVDSHTHSARGQSNDLLRHQA